MRERSVEGGGEGDGMRGGALGAWGEVESLLCFVTSERGRQSAAGERARLARGSAWTSCRTDRRRIWR